MEKLEFKCGCGQTTHLELNEATGQYHYAANPHGNDSIQRGCFNCGKALDIPVKENPVEIETKKLKGNKNDSRSKSI